MRTSSIRSSGHKTQNGSIDDKATLREAVRRDRELSDGTVVGRRHEEVMKVLRRAIVRVDQAPLDQADLAKYRLGMPRTLTVSKARASFSRVTRGVLKSGRPVLVRTPKGLVQIAPYDLTDEVPPAPAGALKYSDREIELSNMLGDML